MYYPEELIEEIRIQNDIIDVISENVQLKRKGSSYFGLCPFHNEKTASFSVSSDKQMYYCFGCGAGGNVYTFIMEYENFSFLEAVKYLADRSHIDLPTIQLSDEMKKRMDFKQVLIDINKDTARYFYYQLQSDKGKKALEYLKNRGISEEIRKKFGLGYSNFFRNDLYRYLKSKDYSDKALLESGVVIPERKSSNEFFDRFFNRVMFPIFDVHNRVIGFGGRVLGEGNPKYLNSPETKLFDKSKNLYGLNLARSSRRNNIIIVEGYMDVISLYQAGFTNVVATLGTALTSGQASLLRKYIEEVILSYDNDSAGIRATLRAIPILKSEGLRVRVLKLERFKDPDELIKLEGAEVFETLLDTAIPSFMFEVEQIENNYNLEDPEHKTRFTEAIAKKIIEIENELERENYLDAITSKYNIKKSLLEQLISDIAKNTGIISSRKVIKRNSSKNSKKEDGILLAQKNILSIVANRQDIYEVVKKYLKTFEFTDGLYKRIATEIYNYYERNNKMEQAIIINKFIELDEQNTVASLFNSKPYDNNIQLEKIINDNVKIIKSYNIDVSSRVVEDPKELQRLILAKRELQQLHISLNHG